MSGPHNTSFPDLPPAPPSRVVGQGYSASHPVPTVQSYRDTQAKHDAEAQQYADIVEARRKEAEERERLAEADNDEEDTRVPTNATSPLSSINNHGPPANQKPDIKHEVKEEEKDEKNAVKSNSDKKKNAVKTGPASEKDKMMQQMNANQSESGVEPLTVLIRCSASYGSLQTG